jgi:hypothetical protein
MFALQGEWESRLPILALTSPPMMGMVSFWDLGQVLLEENHDHIVSVKGM